MLRHLMNERGLTHEVIVIALSYAFIFTGAWNDRLLGFEPSAWSRAAELVMAALLASEVVMRIAFTQRSRRLPTFWALVALDIVSILTIFPALVWIAFARVIRMFYAAWRLTTLLDGLADKHNNGMYITAIFPFVVPLLAAAVYGLEREAHGSNIHTYLDALKVCLAFSLTLGNVRPVTDPAKIICGGLFLLGLLTIGILTNTISLRYQPENRGL